MRTMAGPIQWGAGGIARDFCVRFFRSSARKGKRYLTPIQVFWTKSESFCACATIETSHNVAAQVSTSKKETMLLLDQGCRLKEADLNEMISTAHQK